MQQTSLWHGPNSVEGVPVQFWHHSSNRVKRGPTDIVQVCLDSKVRGNNHQAANLHSHPAKHQLTPFSSTQYSIAKVAEHDERQVSNARDLTANTRHAC